MAPRGAVAASRKLLTWRSELLRRGAMLGRRRGVASRFRRARSVRVSCRPRARAGANVVDHALEHRACGGVVALGEPQAPAREIRDDIRRRMQVTIDVLGERLEL